MSKLFNPYIDGNTLTPADHNKSVVDLNNILVKAGNNNGVALSEFDDKAVKEGVNYISTARGQAFDVGGTANNITLTTNSRYQHLALQVYKNFLKIGFIAVNTNTGAVVVNTDNLGNKTIKDLNNNDLQANQIIAGQYYELLFNEVNNCFIALNLKQQVSGVVKTNTLSLQRQSNDILLIKAGMVNAGDYSEYIKTATDLSVDFTTEGINGRATGNARGTNKFHYLFICKKSDGTIGVVADENFDGALALTTFDNAGYETAKMRYTGSIRVDGSGNIMGFKQTGVQFDYTDEIQNFSGTPTNNTWFTQSLSVPLAPNINWIGVMSSVYISTGVVTLSHFIRITGTNANPVGVGGGAISGYTQVLTSISSFPVNELGQADFKFIYSTPANSFFIRTRGFHDYNF